jgi:hypothetical protein
MENASMSGSTAASVASMSASVSGAASARTAPRQHPCLAVASSGSRSARAPGPASRSLLPAVSAHCYSPWSSLSARFAPASLSTTRPAHCSLLPASSIATCSRHRDSGSIALTISSPCIRYSPYYRRPAPQFCKRCLPTAHTGTGARSLHSLQPHHSALGLVVLAVHPLLALFPTLRHGYHSRRCTSIVPSPLGAAAWSPPPLASQSLPAPNSRLIPSATLRLPSTAAPASSRRYLALLIGAGSPPHPPFTWAPALNACTGCYPLR